MAYEENLEPQQIERANANKQARQVEANDWKWLLSSKQGRRFTWRLLSECGVFRSSFTGNSETFFREGKRAVGLHMLAEISAHCPEQYALMQAESKAQST